MLAIQTFLSSVPLQSARAAQLNKGRIEVTCNKENKCMYCLQYVLKASIYKNCVFYFLFQTQPNFYVDLGYVKCSTNLEVFFLDLPYQ